MHGVYATATQALTDYEFYTGMKLGAISKVRFIEDEIIDAELDIAERLRVENPGMKIMEFKKLLADTVAAELKDKRKELREAKDLRDEGEAKQHVAEHVLRTTTARMMELNGLLQFYAAAKAQARPA